MMYFLCEVETLEREINNANGSRAHGCLELDDVGKALEQFNRQDVVVVAGVPFSQDPREMVTVVIMIQARNSAVGKAMAVPAGKVETLRQMTRESIVYVFPDLIESLRNIP